eukprot:gene7719-19821_t
MGRRPSLDDAAAQAAERVRLTACDAHTERGKLVVAFVAVLTDRLLAAASGTPPLFGGEGVPDWELLLQFAILFAIEHAAMAVAMHIVRRRHIALLRRARADCAVPAPQRRQWGEVELWELVAAVDPPTAPQPTEPLLIV